MLCAKVSSKQALYYGECSCFPTPSALKVKFHKGHYAKVRSVLWMKNESDCKQPETQHIWLQNFLRLQEFSALLLLSPQSGSVGVVGAVLSTGAAWQEMLYRPPRGALWFSSHQASQELLSDLCSLGDS